MTRRSRPRTGSPSGGRLRVSVAGALLATALLAGGPAADTPVADAARRGDTEAVRALLREGADVNAAHGDGMSALHWAARGGHADMARVLIYAGANLAATTRVGSYRPLHLAARVGSEVVVSELVAAGADTDAPSATGVTPLHLAAASGSVGAVAVLLDHGAHIDAREAAAGQTPLIFAASAGRRSTVELLLERGADVVLRTEVVDYVARSEWDSQDQRRRAKRMAALQADEEARRTTLEPKDPTAELRGKDGEERAAAAEAASREEAAPAGGEEVVVSHGEEAPRGDEEKPGAGEEEPPSEPDPDDQRPEPAESEAEASTGDEDPEEDEPEPLSYADLVGRQGGMSALHHAAREGHVGVARALLAAGADIDQATDGDRSTPLLVATINGHYDLAMILLEEGADPTVASDAGATPLFTTLNNRWAPKALYPQPTAFKQQRTTYLELMEALLEAGADPNARLGRQLWYTSYNFDLLGVDMMGATPFWRAAYATDVGAMRLLVAHGADPSIPTKKAPQRRRRGEKEVEDPTGLLPVPVFGPAVLPIHAASGVGYGQEYAANAHRHVPNGWLPAVKYLVEELGADVNARDHQGYTPLHHAAARGDNELILYLVEKGADVMAVSRKGQTTVDMANGPQQRVQPFPETIALLESMGAMNNHDCVSC